MNKILLALTILSAGAGTFLSARQSTTRLQHEAQATREAWLAQTQRVAVAQSDQAGLSNRVRELNQVLAQPQGVEESALWSALQTNGAGHLTPELRASLLEELGFNWQSSPDFIMVSKEAVRELGLRVIGNKGNVTDIAATVLSVTPGERDQVEAAMLQVQTVGKEWASSQDAKDWASSHIERSEPKDNVVAQYSLPGDPPMLQSLSNDLASAVSDAVGRQRAELIMPSAANWTLMSTGIYSRPTTMTVRRHPVGDEPRLNVQIVWGGGAFDSGDLWLGPPWGMNFPEVFRPIFPDGWADLAKREGFAWPEEPQKK